VVGIQHRVILYKTTNVDIYLQLIPAPPKVLQKFLFRNINSGSLGKEELGQCNHQLQEQHKEDGPAHEHTENYSEA